MIWRCVSCFHARTRYIHTLPREDHEMLKPMAFLCRSLVSKIVRFVLSDFLNFTNLLASQRLYYTLGSMYSHLWILHMWEENAWIVQVLCLDRIVTWKWRNLPREYMVLHVLASTWRLTENENKGFHVLRFVQFYMGWSKWKDVYKSKSFSFKKSFLFFVWKRSKEWSINFSGLSSKH